MADFDDSHLERNAAELERLRRLGAQVLTGDLPPRLPVGWTAAAVFAHLAFWDRLVLARWDAYERSGGFEVLPDGMEDLVNAAGLPLWRALEAGAAVVQAVAAATELCERISSLGPEAVVHAHSTGRPRMLDRTPHWTPHLDELAGRAGVP